MAHGPISRTRAVTRTRPTGPKVSGPARQREYRTSGCGIPTYPAGRTGRGANCAVTAAQSERRCDPQSDVGCATPPAGQATVDAEPDRQRPAPVRWMSRQRPQPATGKGVRTHGRPDGGRHRPREAPGDRVPVIRDLRRAALVVGLRPSGGRATPERPERVVEGDGSAARRHRGPGGRDHHVPAGLGGVRPRRGVPRPA